MKLLEHRISCNKEALYVVIMNPEDIDDFVKKTTILEQTINGIANGTIDDKQIDLREYGILTIEQQKEKDERESQVKKELEKKRAEMEEREKEAERRQWWENAESIYGPRFDNERKRLGDERAEVSRTHTLIVK